MYQNKRCLFCKKNSNASNSEEHIIPESIGSKKKVLPKGIVCDRCNNYFAVKVEKPILSHQSFRNIRAYYQVPNKKGKIPSLLGILKDSNIEVTFKLDKNNAPQILPLNEGNKTEFSRIIDKEDITSVFFSLDINPPQKEMSRFLAKMALEAMAFRILDDQDWINSLIDNIHFDLIRDYARLGNNFSEWPYHQRRIFPINTQMQHPNTKEWVQVGFGHDLLITPRLETYFIFMFYGVEFAINIGGPSIKGYEEWLSDNNNISPLIERVGDKIVSRMINNKVEYFIEGDSDLLKGIFFDAKKANLL